MGFVQAGWHVPSDSAWMTLEMTLGMSDEQVGLTGFRGTDEHLQLKTTYGWLDSLNGNNSSGFSALPAETVQSMGSSTTEDISLLGGVHLHKNRTLGFDT